MLLDDSHAAAATEPLRRSGRRASLGRSYAESVPPSLRRHFGDAAPPMPDLPPELAFLAFEGLGTRRLEPVARAAEAAGVSGEAALFAGGVSEETYYRLLAQHLGVPYLDEPLPLIQTDWRDAELTGTVRLAPNGRGLHHVLAPQGEALRELLRDHASTLVARYDFAILAPCRLAALLRRHDHSGLVERAGNGLSAWNAELSARGGATRAQKTLMLAALVAFLTGVVLAPGTTSIVSALVLALLFSAAVAHRLVVTAASPRSGDGPEPTERQPDRDLPVYTLLVPLFREARVVPNLVRNLDALDYPRAKLDIRILLEAGDRNTIAAVARLGLPARYTPVVLPDGHPRTKPRALNAGLEAARGEFVVVYDAEDRPDPAQLRDAVRCFAQGPANLACLQARLTVDHAGETWMTRMFALEYAGLFHAVKPGLAALGLPVPLGGTSNHFRVADLRRVGGWDAWNVTEDIDLGFRLARCGFAVRSLASDTFEEAPLDLARWMPQRSRWMKGWMVTLLVLSRNPMRAVTELGWVAGLSVAVALLGTIASCLFGPPLLAWLLAEVWFGTAFRADTTLRAVLATGSATLLAGGLAAAAWPVALGLKRLGRLDLAPWIATLPLYLLLVSAATWKALIELWRDPQRWNKTEHGLARKRSVPHRT